MKNKEQNKEAIGQNKEQSKEQRLYEAIFGEDKPQPQPQPYGPLPSNVGMAQKVVEAWKKRLRMTDWLIEIHPFEDICDMPNDSTVAFTEYEEVGRTAIIRIVKPCQAGDNIRSFNWERILAHELLHIKFCLLREEEGSLSYRVLHQLIEDMSYALVR